MQIIREKVGEAQSLPNSRQALEQMLVQVLPVDNTRLAFARVWLSFCGEAVAGEDIRGHLASTDDLYRTDLANTVRRGQEANEFDKALDPDQVADTLGALATGLSTRTVIEGQNARPLQIEATVNYWVSVVAPERLASNATLGV